MFEQRVITQRFDTKMIVPSFNLVKHNASHKIRLLNQENINGVMAY